MLPSKTTKKPCYDTAIPVSHSSIILPSLPTWLSWPLIFHDLWAQDAAGATNHYPNGLWKSKIYVVLKSSSLTHPKITSKIHGTLKTYFIGTVIGKRMLNHCGWGWFISSSIHVASLEPNMARLHSKKIWSSPKQGLK